MKEQQRPLCYSPPDKWHEAASSKIHIYLAVCILQCWSYLNSAFEQSALFPPSCQITFEYCVGSCETKTPSSDCVLSTWVEGALRNKPAPFGCIRRQRLCWLAHFWREFYICMAESIQLKLPFALSGSPSNSKWGPQQSCCFLSLHHLPQFYHHWQAARKLQGQMCIKQIIPGCQQIMWGSDANLFTTFLPIH